MRQSPGPYLSILKSLDPVDPTQVCNVLRQFSQSSCDPESTEYYVVEVLVSLLQSLDSLSSHCVRHPLNGPSTPFCEVRALTVKQPWASAIVKGVKTIENRSWALNSLPSSGKWLFVHASKNADPADIRHLWPDAHRTPRPTGALIGLMHVKQVCLLESLPDPSPWASGPYCWVLDAAIEFAQPIACLGALQLWPLDPYLTLAAWDQIPTNYRHLVQSISD